MSTQIAMRLEREYIKDERPKIYDDERSSVGKNFDELDTRRIELRDGKLWRFCENASKAVVLNKLS